MNAEIVERCFEALGRERAKPPADRRNHLIRKWEAEIERCGGELGAIPGTFANEANDARR